MKRQTLLTLAFMLAFGVLGVWYMHHTPLYETSDEVVHYPVIEHLKTTRTLPIQEPGVRTRFEQEGSQPPLYYALGALLTSWIDTGDYEDIHWRNPHVKVGVTFLDDNKNFVIHTEAEEWPWSGTVLATNLMRLWGVALGMGTVGLTGVLARRWWPEDDALLIGAMALTAFNPMYLHIAASVNNDNLIIFLAAWQLVIVTGIVQEGLTPQRVWGIALLFTVGSLTKVSGLVLAPVIGVGFLVVCLRDGAWRAAFRAGFVMLTVWTVGAGWWYARNLLLYGEITGTASQVAIVGGRDLTVWQAISSGYANFWRAYWGWFGSLNILAEGWMITIFGVITFTSLAGLTAWVLIKREQLLPISLYGGAIVLMIASVISWTMRTYASQGRLVFPVISAISMLCALGLTWWVPQRLRLASVGLWALPLLAVAISVPPRLIAPAYAPPPSVAALPDATTAIGTQWGPLTLVGLELTPSIRKAGSFAPVTAYWRLDEPTEENLSIVYRLVGRGNAVLGSLTTYPGGGAWATSTMPVGTIIVDSYRIPTDAELDTPTQTTLEIYVGQDTIPLTPSERRTSFTGPIMVPTTCDGTPTQAEPTLDVMGNVAQTITFGETAQTAVRIVPAERRDALAFELRVEDITGDVVADRIQETRAGWVPGCPFEEVLVFPMEFITRTGTYTLVVNLRDTHTGETIGTLGEIGTISIQVP